jgi:hypothetical protein
VNIMQVGAEEIRPRKIDKDLAGRDLVRLTVEDGHLVAYGFGRQRFTVPLQGGGPRPITLEYYRVTINKPETRLFRNYTGLAVYGPRGGAEIDIWGEWDMAEVRHFAESHGLLVVNSTGAPLNSFFRARRKVRTIPRDKWVTDVLLIPVFFAILIGMLMFAGLSGALGSLIDSAIGWGNRVDDRFPFFPFSPFGFVFWIIGWVIAVPIGVWLMFLVSGLFRAGLRSLLRHVFRK